MKKKNCSYYQLVLWVVGRRLLQPFDARFDAVQRFQHRKEFGHQPVRDANQIFFGNDEPVCKTKIKIKKITADEYVSTTGGLGTIKFLLLIFSYLNIIPECFSINK